MIIDMHVHTLPLSRCSNIDPEEAIRRAREIGLNGLCFTEHEITWRSEEIQRLRDKWNFPVFCGIEVNTSEGHILVFGIRENQKNLLHIRRFQKLQDFINGSNGILIFAHPFRDALFLDNINPQPIIQNACTKEVFKKVEAIEVFNGKSKTEENRMAQELSARLMVKGLGGSDAHNIQEIGRCATFFENEITNEEQLVEEIKSGRFKASYFRN